MEGRTQASRSIPEPSYLPGNGNPGPLGGGTYTGNSLEPLQADWENIFGPAGRDIKLDHQRQKRHQRWHLPDVLRGPNNYLTDRIDGLITDTTSSPFTTVILPYKYIANPDAKIKWNAYSYDEGLATRVPYESAARVLTQTKRSYSAYVVRHGLAIEMEHNFMMSAQGMQNFSNQVKQLVGSIQMSNDLDVHIALVQAPSYAKEYMEKYSSTDKTAYQICREYVDLFGMMQKNPNALDILIEEAKIQLRIWGAPEPTFLLCNSKLTFHLQMPPDRTNYVTHGIDGVNRLRQGPDIASYRGLSIINSRAYSMEVGTVPRDVLRRRVRVAEYYRVPPQKDANWEVELYDESRDTWFKLTPEDLDKYADLSGGSGSGGPGSITVDDANRLTWHDFIHHQGLLLEGNRFQLKMDAEPDSTTVTMPKLLRPGEDLAWNATLGQIQTMLAGVFHATHTRNDYHAICSGCDAARVFVPRPNHTNYVDVECPIEARNVPFWLFMNAAFLNSACHFLWTQLNNLDRDLVRQKIIPFVYGANHRAILDDYNAIPDDARINIYHTVMFLGTSLRWHPDDDVRRVLEAKFAERRIGIHTLRAALVHFVKRCLDDSVEPVPDTRIQLGKRLDDVFKGGRFAQAEEARAVFLRWPYSPPGILPIALAAGVAENTGSLEDYRIEEKYNTDGMQYTWNRMPRIRSGGDASIHEPTVLDSFFYAALLRMMTHPTGVPQWPDFWPVLKAKGSNEAVEYVIVRPVIEHNMLGIIMGRGGDNELGNTFWGQTELSCYDDSFHGVWGMSYKYHSRAIVANSRNLIRCWDVGYDGYNGGKDDRCVDWQAEAPGNDRPFNQSVSDMSVPYNGPSLMVMKFHVNTSSRDYRRNWPSPIVFHDKLDQDPPKCSIDPDSLYAVSDSSWRVFNQPEYREQYRAYLARMPDFSYYHQTRKLPGYSSVDAESTQNAFAFQGSMRVVRPNNGIQEIHGSGHHGADYVGVAAIRAGKGMRPMVSAPSAMRLV